MQTAKTPYNEQAARRLERKVRVNIKQLHMLLALADSGSMTVTAKKLRVTQPALTYQLKNIESELGFHVFERTRTGTTLTQEGRYFCDSLHDVLAKYDEAVRMTRLLARNYAGQIRIGIDRSSRDLATLLLRLDPNAMENLSFATIPCGSSNAYDLLKQGMIDFWSSSEAALGRIEGSDVRFEKLIEAPLMIHISQDHRLAGKPVVRIDDLAGETVWMWPRGSFSRASDGVRDVLESQGIDITIKEYSDGIPPLTTALSENEVALFDQGYLPPPSPPIVTIPLDYSLRDNIGFVYLADEGARLANALDAIRSTCNSFADSTSSDASENVTYAISLLNNIAGMVHRGGLEGVKPLVQYALELGIPARQIINQGLAAGMYAVNQEMKQGKQFTRAMQASVTTMRIGSELLMEALAREGETGQLGHAIIGTVEGDMHDMGKSLVSMMLSANNIQVSDLGVNIAPNEFVEHVLADPLCNLVLISASQDSVRPNVEAVINLLEESGLRDRVFVMVGGPGIDDEFARAIGADAFTLDASEAARVAVGLLSY